MTLKKPQIEQDISDLKQSVQDLSENMSGDAISIQGKSVPTPTTTDDGKALVYDNTANAFKYATASGGTTDISDTLTAEDLVQGEVVGQPTSIYYVNPADKPPVTPNAHDYEFEASDTTTLPTGWSWVNQQTATYRERYGRGIIYYPTLTPVQIIGIERTLPTDSTWEYCVKADIACWHTSYYEYDIFVRDSTTNKMFTFSVDGRGLTYKRWNSPISWNAEVGFYPVSYARSPMYLKIRKNSNTSYDFLYSYDGIEWLAMFSALDLSTWSSNFDKIGIGFSVNTDSNKGGIGYMYWFRRTK